MDLRSQGWDYASEMVLKSVHMQLRTTEVPIHFLKDPEGRISHMKRRGFLEPWRAGWMNLRAMFTYGVDFFLLKPGMVILGVGLIMLIPLSFGPVQFGAFSLSLNTMLLAMAMASLGLSMLFFGGIAGVMFDYSGTLGKRIEGALPYNATFVGCVVATSLGVALTLPLVRTFVDNHYLLPEIGRETHWAVLGLWLVIAAFQTFIFLLMIARSASCCRGAPSPRHNNDCPRGHLAGARRLRVRHRPSIPEDDLRTGAIQARRLDLAILVDRARHDRVAGASGLAGSAGHALDIVPDHRRPDADFTIATRPPHRRRFSDPCSGPISSSVDCLSFLPQALRQPACVRHPTPANTTIPRSAGSPNTASSWVSQIS